MDPIVRTRTFRPISFSFSCALHYDAGPGALILVSRGEKLPVRVGEDEEEDPACGA